MSKMLCVLFCILQFILFTHGQNATTMPPVELCTPASMVLTCPNNHVVMIRTAFYGIKQTPGACSYAAGDCIADGMSAMTCLSDTASCSPYAGKKKLTQCNDQESEYFHVEFDCVPIVMDDSAKVYDACQNGTAITSDHGIIRSPGYPGPVQTTTIECFQAIQIPDDKILRLWLTDLYIGSTSTNCADDHLYVVDSIQTYKHCGERRYVYPYLCSSTILIQYLIKTDLSIYRGMRMYFEVTDRPIDDTCPKGTVTPVPMSTTTGTTIEPDGTTAIPGYAQLGIASPTQTFQMCAGQSHTINCPANYAVSILTNIFGISSSGQCDPRDSKDCASTISQPSTCQESCYFQYPGNEIIPSCNSQVATYQYVEYQCIPTNTEVISTNTSCAQGGSKIDILFDRNSRFQSYNYPKLTQMDCTYRLKTQPGNIIHLYALDISLTDDPSQCSTNRMTLNEDDGQNSTSFCKQSPYSLIYSSCSNELDLHYLVENDTYVSSYGLDLYLESQTRPFDWKCGSVSPTPTDPPTTRTVPSTPQATSIDPGSFMGAMEVVEYDICYDNAINYACPQGYTFMIVDAYYGVKSQGSSTCGFTENDCTQEATASITQCQTDSPNCYLPYSTKRRLAHCSDQYADYLHLIFQCVPSVSVQTSSQLNYYDICNTSTAIRDIHGVIASPYFPQYVKTNGECTRDMFGVSERLLKIWVNQMSIQSGGQRSLDDDDLSSNSNQADFIIYKTNEFDDIELMYPAFRDTCVTDYLIINTRNIAYIFCGTRKLSLEPICTSSAIIQYKTTAEPNIAFRGFKLYFEWIEKPMEVICAGTPGTVDPSATTTTPAFEPLPPWAQNLDVSPLFTKQICLGTADSIKCPRANDYVIAIEDTKFGVTTTGVCDLPSFSDCTQRAALSLTCTHTCFIEYLVPRPLSNCQNQTAHYLTIDYECIPTRLANDENPLDICASTPTDTIALDKGIMISPKYPLLNAAYSCLKTIETVPSKIWMIYIVDLFLESEALNADCTDASLTINDGNDIVTICGLQQPQLTLMSCSNIVRFSFRSSQQALGYRGFKVFFRSIDVPVGWSCTPSGFSTTTQLTTIQTSPPTTLIPPTLRVAAYGGTITGDSRRYCELPFTYAGTEYQKCIADKPPNATAIQTDSWCSLTKNYDTDSQWGFCDIGVTDITSYDVCRSRSQTLRCSDGYVIDIVTADLAAQEDRPFSCNYVSTDCFQSEISSVQSACAGRVSCTILNPGKSLASCQNRASAYLRVEYTCVPTNIPEIKTYDICDRDSILPDDVRRGFLFSPAFPSTPSNLSCTFDIQSLKPRQDTYLYIIEMSLNDPDSLGQSCSKDQLIITDSSNMRETCGLSFTNLIVRTCHSPLTVQLIRTPDARGRGVKLYFEFRDRRPNEICQEIITPSTPSTLVPTSPGSSTSPSRPIYFPDPSTRMVKNLCHPDISGSFGAHNLQCPVDYILVIHRAFYGTGDRCAYTPGDCTHEADSVHRDCAGKQGCSVPFENLIHMPQCVQTPNNYLSIEYQCLPTLTIADNIADLCRNKTNVLTGTSGILQSTSYPTYTETECANVTLILPETSELLIYMYLLDLSIGAANAVTGNCTDDYVLLSYQCNDQTFDQYLCSSRQTELLFSTCSPTDKITASYKFTNPDSQSYRGFALLYHLLLKSGLSTVAPGTTEEPDTPDPTNYGGIIGGIIGGLLFVLLIVSGYLYYSRVYAPANKNKRTAVVFRPGQETIEENTTDGNNGQSVSIPPDSLKNPVPLSVNNPSYKAKTPIDDATDVTEA